LETARPVEKTRTFIAVRIPEGVRRKLMEIERELMGSGADVKWVSAENLHITLKFIGPVEPNRVEAAARAVESAVQGITAFEVHLAGVGAFPKVSRPSVVWVGTGRGGEELKSLAERVESACEREGFEREPRPFSPHITIGRVKSPKGLDALAVGLERLRMAEAGSFPVEEVAVMKSELRPSGPVYSELAGFILAGSQ
jgi:2'-5' RNA ligase